MAGNPIVSVCLPTFNGERFLGAAIQSLLSQTFFDFEVIICDDCSSDNTVALIQSFAERDQRIKFFQNEKNCGLFENYNVCLGRVRGRFVKLFAQDDLLEPSCLESMVSVLEQRPDVNLVSCGRCWIDENGVEIDRFRLFKSDMLLPARKVVLYNLLNLTNWVGEPSTVMFRKSSIGTGFATNFYHFGDIEYWFRILGDKEYFYLNRTLASFRRHPDSTTSRNLRGLYFAYDMLQISNDYKHVLEEFGEAEGFFYKRVAERAALNIAWMGRAGDYSCEDMLGATVEYVDTSQARRELLEAKTLAFVSLQYLTEILAKLNDLECRSTDRISSLTREIQELKNSRTWRALAPAREFGKFFKK